MHGHIGVRFIHTACRTFGFGMEVNSGLCFSNLCSPGHAGTTNIILSHRWRPVSFPRTGESDETIYQPMDINLTKDNLAHPLRTKLPKRGL